MRSKIILIIIASLLLCHCSTEDPETRESRRILEAAIEKYRRDTGYPPPDKNNLQALWKDPGRGKGGLIGPWQGPYVKKDPRFKKFYYFLDYAGNSKSLSYKLTTKTEPKNRKFRYRYMFESENGNKISGAVEDYRGDVGHYPAIEEGGLEALAVNPQVKGWDGPYIEKDSWWMLSDFNYVLIGAYYVMDEKERGVDYSMLEDALRAFKSHVKRVPLQSEGIKAFIEDPGVAGWNGPYLEKEYYYTVKEYIYAYVDRETGQFAPKRRYTPPGERTLDIVSLRNNNAIKKELHVIENALQEFKKDTGHFPTIEEKGLDALFDNPGAKGWNGPYLERKWRKPISLYSYFLLNSEYTLVKSFTKTSDQRKKEEMEREQSIAAFDASLTVEDIKNATPKQLKKIKKHKWLQFTSKFPRIITAALNAFKADVGRYPNNTEGLKALVDNPKIKGWKGPYIPKKLKSSFRGYSYQQLGDNGYRLSGKASKDE